MKMKMKMTRYAKERTHDMVQAGEALTVELDTGLLSLVAQQHAQGLADIQIALLLLGSSAGRALLSSVLALDGKSLHAILGIGELLVDRHLVIVMMIATTKRLCLMVMRQSLLVGEW